MRWVIINKDSVTLQMSIGQKPRVLYNGQCLLRVNESNEESIKEFIKYSQSELLDMDLESDPLIVEKHSQSSVRQPFAEKKLQDGRKLFRRKHGVSDIVTANSIGYIELSSPYYSCKINQLEILGCEVGDTADLLVLDTEDGEYTTVPNYLLDQFGFDVCLNNEMYTDKSNYDASIKMGMQLIIVYKNNSPSDKLIGVNFTLHEVI